VAATFGAASGMTAAAMGSIGVRANRQYSSIIGTTLPIVKLFSYRRRPPLRRAMATRAMGTTQAVVARLESGKTDALDPHLGALREGYAYAPVHQLRAEKERKVR
jgi:hypothetical protein